MLTSSRLFDAVKYVGAVVLFLIFVVPIARNHSWQPYADILRNYQGEKKLFVRNFLDSDLGRDIAGTDLAKLCSSRQWRPEKNAVIVSCEAVPGGFGEVKNGLLNCIRFAIEIGAELILPRIRQRSEADISSLKGGKQAKGLPLTYLFNEAHLRTTLGKYCPKLKIYSSIDDLYDKPSLLQPLVISIPKLDPDYTPPKPAPDTASETGSKTAPPPEEIILLRDPGKLRAFFATYFDTKLPPENRHYPVRVHLEPSIFVWPPITDGEQVRSDLGKLLRARDDVRALAASALWNMVRNHSLPMPHLRKGYGPPPPLDTVESAKGMDAPLPPTPPLGYIGVHLRLEKDAIDSKVIPHYEDQSAYFLTYLSDLNLPLPSSAGALQPPARATPQRTVYLATGLSQHHKDVQRFRDAAAERNATVVTKHDLLVDAGEREMMHALTFDQRALIDREVLLRAGLVLGVVESSFAWEIALKRAVSFEDGKGLQPDEGFTLRPESTVRGRMMWKDRFTRLYGVVDRAAVIYYGTWP